MAACLKAKVVIRAVVIIRYLRRDLFTDGKAEVFCCLNTLWEVYSVGVKCFQVEVLEAPSKESKQRARWRCRMQASRLLAAADDLHGYVYKIVPQ